MFQSYQSVSVPGTGFFSNSTYVFDIDTAIWSLQETRGAQPEGRCGHTACVVS